MYIAQLSKRPDAGIIALAEATISDEQACNRAFDRADENGAAEQGRTVSPQDEEAASEAARKFWRDYRELLMMTPQTVAGVRAILRCVVTVGGCEDEDVAALLLRLLASPSLSP